MERLYAEDKLVLGNSPTNAEFVGDELTDGAYQSSPLLPPRRLVKKRVKSKERSGRLPSNSGLRCGASCLYLTKVSD